MDTRQLAAFCAVVERKSFSQAAERLGVTQPALSLQIRALEKRLRRPALEPPGQRGVSFEPFFRDEVILATPPDHRFAGRTITLEELRKETLIVMQEGGGVRQLLEDELRRSGERLRDFEVPLELGLQESVRSAVLAGYGVTFISRSAVEADLGAGRLGEARVRGLNLVRDVSLVRAARKSPNRVAEAFVAFGKERLA